MERVIIARNPDIISMIVRKIEINFASNVDFPMWKPLPAQFV